MVWCTVGSTVGPEVVRPRDRWNLRRADYDGFRCDLLELPRPVEGSTEDMCPSFRTQFLNKQQRRIPRKRVGGTERLQPSWFHGREARKRKRFYHAAKCNPTGSVRVGLVSRTSLTFTNMCSVSVTVRGGCSVFGLPQSLRQSPSQKAHEEGFWLLKKKQKKNSVELLVVPFVDCLIGSS